MELSELIDALSRPAAYPHAVNSVEVRQTHISLVFLAGPFVYKIKKSVELGFLDFSTLEKRAHYCAEEIRLNRRLAPSIYRSVVPVTRSGNEIRFEGVGEVVEWAVQMQRLPEKATLLERLYYGEIGVSQIQSLAGKIAHFHTHAETGEHISNFGKFDQVARNARENFEQTAPQVGTTLSPAVFQRLQTLNEESLNRLQFLMESRARLGVPRDTHGDLHLDHVYFFPHEPPPHQWVIIDCIEFNERFRFADPVADMAFLVMDLIFHGRADLARAFSQAYFQEMQDTQGRELLPFYTAYRAAVRGKVEGFELAEKEIPEEEKSSALARARAHWLLALGELEKPGRKPCLVIVGGLPGSGKSSLALALAHQADFQIIRSDLVRKELAGLSASDPSPAPFGAGLYAPELMAGTYSECLRRAADLLFDGKRVLVDASFGVDQRRRDFLDLAYRLGVPGIFFLCQANPETIHLRLSRRRGDPSDADWSVFLKAAELWEEPGPQTRPFLKVIANDSTQEDAAAQAWEYLREKQLLD